MSRFGRFLQELRTRKGIALREFCRRANLDPSNWSKVERGLLPPPKDSDAVKNIANALGIEKDSEEWRTLFDLAAIGHIPSALISENFNDYEDNLAVILKLARNSIDCMPSPKQYRDMIAGLKTSPKAATPDEKPEDKDKKGNKD